MRFYSKVIFACSFLIILASCQEDEVEPLCADLPDDFELSETQALFLDLVFDQEFGQSAERLRKWNKPIRIFVEGNAPEEVLSEVDQVIGELNNLSSHIPVTKVYNLEEANLRFFLGEKEDYVALVEPGAAGIAEGNNGFATIAWNDDYEISRASACVDVINITDMNLLKHVIREEMAQTLGLINDTELDEESIFYQFSSTSKNYTEADETMISRMLGNELSAGMCKAEVLKGVE
jgi:hypothetical protein